MRADLRGGGARHEHGNVPGAVRTRANRCLPLAALLASVIALLACAASGIGGVALLHFLPVLLLGCALLARRYPGESALLRWAREPATRRPRARSFASPRPRPAAHVPRGGLLMAFALAVRPPPASAITS